MLKNALVLTLVASAAASVLPLERRTGTHPDNTGLVRAMAPFSNYIDNPYPLQLPNGRILLIVRNHYRPNFVNLTQYRLSMFVSDDNGSTFSYLNDAVTKTPTIEGDAQGLYEPFMRIAQDGSLQLYYSEENPSAGADQDSIMRTSTDIGVTWSEAKTISGAGITARDGMLGVVNTGGSNLIAVFETTEAQPDYGFVVSSVTSDDGKTWGNRRRVFTPDTPDHAAGSPQVIQVGGTTVVSFMNSEDTQYSGYNGTNATILTSEDGGMRLLGNKYNVFDMGANEPGMLTLKSWTTDFIVMTSIEPPPQGTFDGALKSQRVVLS